jgi:hypothetical protein
MKKPKEGNLCVLFATRLLLYFGVFSLPLIHPGISVAYDRSGIILWFLVVPLEALIAFLPGPSRLTPRLRLILGGLVLIIGAVFATGLNLSALPFLGIGSLSFVLTALLFRFPRWGKIAVFEQIFFVLICFRMLGFSRSSEDVANMSSALTQGILIFSIAAFLLHGTVIYFSLYRRPAGGDDSPQDGRSRRGKKRREFAVFALCVGAAVVLLLFVLPPDFVKNSVIANLLQDEVNPPPVPIDEDGDGFPDGNLRSNRGNRQVFPRGGNGNGQGGSPRLEGIPESRWPGQGSGSSGEGEGQGRGQGDGETKQYAVMVVAAKTDPVYAGSSYRGSLHPLRGFLPTENEILNKLPAMRLLETWFDTEYTFDLDRFPEEIFFLSTLPEKYLPYRPSAVEPTVLQRGYGPFRYSHRVRSNMSTTGPLQWAQARDLTADEKEEYQDYLDAALAKNDLAVFDAHLRGALRAEENAGGYFDRILAILKSFSDFQYNAGYSEDNTSIPALVDFLTYTKEGDCTEFSNVSAILGRLAGIPSRVVTGFLASGELQTPAHVRGLVVLRNQIKLLQDFPLEELYLVTTAHRHSWTQFWLPDYGWIDFEATSFAIPPMGLGDANNRDVVIPIFEKEPELMPIRAFPWKLVLRGLGIFLSGALFCAYALRYGRELFLWRRSLRNGVKGIRAVYAFLLMRLAAEGRPVKLPAQTSKEYAEIFPEEPLFAPFAALYTELRYREIPDPGEQRERHKALREEAAKILKGLRRPGLRGVLFRLFSLRGLVYLL